MHFVSSEPLRKNITENCDVIESVQQDFLHLRLKLLLDHFEEWMKFVSMQKIVLQHCSSVHIHIMPG